MPGIIGRGGRTPGIIGGRCGVGMPNTGGRICGGASCGGPCAGGGSCGGTEGLGAMTGGGGRDWAPAPGTAAPGAGAGVGRMTGGGREEGWGPSLGGGGRLASGSFLLPSSTCESHTAVNCPGTLQSLSNTRACTMQVTAACFTLHVRLRRRCMLELRLSMAELPRTEAMYVQVTFCTLESCICFSWFCKPAPVRVSPSQATGLSPPLILESLILCCTSAPISSCVEPAGVHFKVRPRAYSN